MNIKNMQLVKTIPAGENHMGWTEQRLYNSDEGYLYCMAVNNARQNTIDGNTVMHVSTEWAQKFIAEA